MPRNRTARFAVLGSSAQRPAASGYSSTRSSALRRKIVVGCLVAALARPDHALVPLRRARPRAELRRVGAAAVRDRGEPRRAAVPRRGRLDERPRPRQVRERAAEAGERRRSGAARRARRRRWRRTSPAAAAARTTATRRRSRRTTEPSAADGARRIRARFDQSVTITAGSNQGVAVEDVVVAAGALVGQVTKVYGNVARVMLISDPSSAVRAVDARNLGDGRDARARQRARLARRSTASARTSGSRSATRS